MLDERTGDDIGQRLKKIEGQIRGIAKMLEEKRYCIDILTQTRAIVAALRKVEDLIMYSHLKTCVAGSMRSDDAVDQEAKIDEIMDILSRFRKTG